MQTINIENINLLMHSPLFIKPKILDFNELKTKYYKLIEDYDNSSKFKRKRKLYIEKNITMSKLVSKIVKNKNNGLSGRILKCAENFEDYLHDDSPRQRCGNRLCALCNWHINKQIRQKLFDTLKYLRKENPTIRFKFLTIGTKAIPLSNMNELNSRILEMNGAFGKMIASSSFQKFLNNDFSSIYIKTLDLKISNDAVLPHFHVVLAMPNNTNFRKHYLSKAKIEKLWTKYSGMTCYRKTIDYKTMNFTDDDFEGISRYITKLSEYLDLCTQPNHFNQLIDQLRDMKLLTVSKGFKRALEASKS